jgi:hypothetical protein
MNGKVTIILFSAVVGAAFLTAGCHGRAQTQYSSAPFLLDSAISGVDSLKMYLPRKNANELMSATAAVSGALKASIDLVPSAGGKAEVQKASETYEKELRPVIMSLDYDPVAIGKKLDDIRATLVKVSKEVK